MKEYKVSGWKGNEVKVVRVLAKSEGKAWLEAKNEGLTLCRTIAQVKK